MITNLFLSTLVAIGPVARPQLPQLTHNDYVNLAKVIRVEAARNTLDEYCVAASILNRVRSNQFPNTVEKVIINNPARFCQELSPETAKIMAQRK